MRIFLTGATGVIGRRVLPLLVALDHGVTALVHRPQSRAEIERAGAVPVHVDLFARDALQRAVAGHDAVINLATHLPARWRMFLPGAWAENDRIRRVASANLVDAAIAGGVTRFIQESFAPAYPDRGEAWIDKRTPLAPVRLNRSLVDAERSAQRFSGGARTGVVLRFAAFYGPDSWFTRDLIRYVRRGFVPMPGTAESYISSVSHDDAATAVVGALSRARAPIMSSTTNPCAAARSSERSRRFSAWARRDWRRHGRSICSARSERCWGEACGSRTASCARSVRGCRSIRACAKAGGRSRPRSRRGSCAASGAPTCRYAVIGPGKI
jgi:nucleoside-diphosphate-sugar epimerase